MTNGDKIKWTIVTGALLALLLPLLFRGSVSAKKEMSPPPAMDTEISIDIIEDMQQDEKKKEPDASEEPDSAPAAESVTESGALPPLNANYRAKMGFAKYAAEMLKRGGRFYIMGASRKQLYEINPTLKTMRKTDIESVMKRNFSPRTRVISDEPALGCFVSQARKKYGIQKPEVILLVPSRMEKRIASILREAAKKYGLPISSVAGFKGYYCMSGGVFKLIVNEAVAKNNKYSINVPIKL